MRSDEKFMNILKENWRHARHIEAERMWFANIYAAIITAVAVYIAQQDTINLLTDTTKIIVIVLLVISVIWLGITVRLSVGFYKHMKAIKKIFDDKKPIGNDWEQYMVVPHLDNWRACCKLPITVAAFLTYFYVAVIGGLIIVLCFPQLYEVLLNIIR